MYQLSFWSLELQQAIWSQNNQDMLHLQKAPNIKETPYNYKINKKLKEIMVDMPQTEVEIAEIIKRQFEYYA